MVGWHQQLDGHELKQALGVGDGQGSLACCSPWGRRVRHAWMSELNSTPPPGRSWYGSFISEMWAPRGKMSRLTAAIRQPWVKVLAWQWSLCSYLSQVNVRLYNWKVLSSITSLFYENTSQPQMNNWVLFSRSQILLTVFGLCARCQKPWVSSGTILEKR